MPAHSKVLLRDLLMKLTNEMTKCVSDRKNRTQKSEGGSSTHLRVSRAFSRGKVADSCSTPSSPILFSLSESRLRVESDGGAVSAHPGDQRPGSLLPSPPFLGPTIDKLSRASHGTKFSLPTDSNAFVPTPPTPSPMSSGNFLNPLGTTTLQRPCLLLAVPGTAREPGEGKEVSEVTRGLNLLCSWRFSHLPSLPCSGVMWPFPPATRRKPQERGLEGGTEKVLRVHRPQGQGRELSKPEGVCVCTHSRC